ncbi:MAG: glycosyltransferase [Deltaproteobacteria bacterium]|nr:MAG: glycosyltransferase [Deltaproteobacteria bacterium]
MERKRKLKIAYVIDTYDGIKTGGVYSAHRFIDALRKDHEITIVTTGEQKPGRVILPGFYFPFAKNLMQKMGFIFAVPKIKLMKKLFKEVDLVHVQLPWWLGIRAVKLANSMGVPVVTGFHMQPENILRNFKIKSQFLSNKIYNLFLSKFFNKSDGVICPSLFAEHELKRFDLKQNSVVISNGIKKDFRPMDYTKDPKYQGKFMILVVGRLAREKRLHILIKAIANSKYKNNIQMVATGNGPLKEELIEMGSHLPNPAEFLFVSQEDLIKLYNTADLYVHTSEVELEGMAVLEAIGCGLPALVSINPTSASGQFALSEDFSFDDDDYRQLARKIDHLIENPQILKEAKPRYLEMASRYKIEDSIVQTEKFYYQIIDNAKRNGPVGKLNTALTNA